MVGALDVQHGNDTFALVEGSKLLRAADFRGVGARTQQRNRDLASVDFALDLAAPDCTPADSLRFEPDIEAFLRKIGLQMLGKGCSVSAGVGDENAQWFR